MIERMTAAEVATHLGLAVSTVYAYRRDGILPEPDMVGRTPTWDRKAIDRWKRNRPGQGAGGGRPRKDAAARA